MMYSTQELHLEKTQSRALSRPTVYPWIVIFFCALFLFFKYVLQVSPSVMTHDLMRAFHINATGLGNLAATYFYAYLIAQLAAGLLLDRYSPRLLTTLAIATCSGGAWLFSSADTLFSAECARALMGAGTAFATVSYMKLSECWFRPNQIAYVDGLLATAAMAGALCGQVPLTLLVTHLGWSNALWTCSAFGAALAFCFYWVVKDKSVLLRTTQSFSHGHAFKFTDFAKLLKDKRNWLLTCYSGLAFTPLAVLGGLWGNPFFEVSHHITALQAATMSSCQFLGLAIGGPLFGFFAARADNRINVMLWGTMLSLLALLIVIYFIQLPLALFGISLFLFGLGTGAFMLCFPFGKSINSLKMAATVVALINTGDAFFGSFTEPLIGQLLDLSWHGLSMHGVHYFSVNEYQRAFSILPCYLLCAIVSLLCLKKITNRS